MNSLNLFAYPADWQKVKMHRNMKIGIRRNALVDPQGLCALLEA
jgi:hypothetical protein